MPNGKSGFRSFLFGSGLGLGLGLLLAPESGEKTRERLRGVGQGLADMVDAGLTVLSPTVAPDKLAATGRTVLEVGRDLGDASRDVVAMTGEELATVLDSARRFFVGQVEAGLSALNASLTAAREARTAFSEEWERRNPGA